MSQDEGRTVSDTLLMLENVLGTDLPRIATLEYRIHDKFKWFDDNNMFGTNARACSQEAWAHAGRRSRGLTQRGRRRPT